MLGLAPDLQSISRNKDPVFPADHVIADPPLFPWKLSRCGHSLSPLHQFDHCFNAREAAVEIVVALPPTALRAQPSRRAFPDDGHTRRPIEQLG
jgi:hypothetical protein